MRRVAASTFPTLDVDFETEQFIRYWRGEGRRKRNWHDAWLKWMADSAKRASERATRPPLRAVSGGYVPHQQPTPEEYASDLGYF